MPSQRSSFFHRVHAAMLALGESLERHLYDAHKRALFADVHGTVVEIGPGPGVNFRYLPRDIQWIGIEPNIYMHDYIRRNLARAGITGEVVAEVAEEARIPDGTADAVISTLVLCSVDDVAASLSEIQRMLRPGGKFYFLEHVAADRDSRRRTVQRALHPLWCRLADGCHIDRETWRHIDEAGFGSVNYRFERIGGAANPIRPHIIGTARKSPESTQS